MIEVEFPQGFWLEPLRRNHRRKAFRSGEPAVDEWLASKALQNQQKRLSVTKVLVDPAGRIAGYYTLATGLVDFAELPHEITRRLPRRALPVAILAWLGVSKEYHGQGLGGRLLAQALRDCYEAGRTFAFVAVILDCISDAAKAFYKTWDFEELPGCPSRLFLSAGHLAAMMESPNA
ncbi:MAG TPA: GNAT family N-acetyltransferase [Planctomycetaceae bacterium]|nr:GNAT family N-acetyltransferase [Planctomycetaceae bacterium]